jgi:hypothetical protein
MKIRNPKNDMIFHNLESPIRWSGTGARSKVAEALLPDMNLPSPLPFKNAGLAGMTSVFLAFFPAQASVIWNDSFTGEANGAAPTSDYTNNGTEDWVVANGANTSSTISGSVGNPSPSLHLADTTTSASTSSTVSMAQFAAFDTTAPGQSTIIISFDFRVDAFSTSVVNSTPQFFLRDNGGTRLTIGFGARSLPDGDASSDLFLFAGAGSNPTPGASNAIGYIADTGWETGFDFGNTSATASDNNTGGNFIHFELTYVNGATSATLLAENGANSTVLTLTGLTASSFSSASSNDSLNFSSGASAISDSYFDNIRVEVVPEPSAALLLAAGLMALGGTRRRRKATPCE